MVVSELLIKKDVPYKIFAEVKLLQVDSYNIFIID